MNYGLTFRYATAADFVCVLELASQLASRIEAEVPPLTVMKVDTYYVGTHAPMRIR
jgi:hypothetical protein